MMMGVAIFVMNDFIYQYRKYASRSPSLARLPLLYRIVNTDTIRYVYYKDYSSRYEVAKGEEAKKMTSRLVGIFYQGR